MRAIVFAAVVLMAMVLMTAAGVSLAADSTTAPSTAPSGSSSKSGASKFYGTISAVDTTAMTFTVDNQVYSIVPETQMTKAADDSTATVADATVGQPGADRIPSPAMESSM